ncbi:BtrH N-terminal domain-containing protein [Gorillibacterium timonense]|uniref:BtrH N-terminal domain-containing protein n=1 Tax=Gorillibacterium timonense TaxID=1689269 RepID=UPI00071DFFDC|nr:BtrH N-terminal domain-containing protein [Gorillibacterium timonense]
MPIIETYQAQKGKLCFTSALHNILLHKGIEVSEEEVFFHCEGLNLVFFTKDHFFGLSPHEQFENLTRSTGIPTVFSYCIDQEDKSAVFLQIENQLHLGNPVLLYCGTHGLDYHPEYSAAFKTEHALVIYGMDEASNRAYVADTYIVGADKEITFYQGSMKLDGLMKGTFGFGWVEEREGSSHALLEDASYVAKRNLMLYLKGDSFGERQFKGIFAVQRFMDYLDEIPTYDEVLMRRDCIEVCHRLRHGALISSLQYLHDYMNNDSRRNEPSALAARTELSELIGKWRRNTTVILRSGLAGRSEMLAKAVQDFHIYAQQQERVFRDILDALGRT